MEETKKISCIYMVATYISVVSALQISFDEIPSEVPDTIRIVIATCCFNRYSHGQYGSGPECEER